MTLKKSGTRVGDWFLWLDVEVAKTDNYRRIAIVTLRKAISGGDIIQTSVATREMANSLRQAADSIDAVIDAVESANDGKDVAA